MKLSFLEMCIKTEEMVKVHDQVCYLYEMNENTLLASLYYLHKDWLFKAYPGGRTILSIRGRGYLGQEECHRCIGKGYFMIGSDEIKCPDCDGMGYK